MIKNIKLTDFILQFKNIYFICSSTSSPLPNKAELPTQNVSKETKRKLNGASAKFAACNCRLCPEQQQTCNVQQQKKKTKKNTHFPHTTPIHPRKNVKNVSGKHWMQNTTNTFWRPFRNDQIGFAQPRARKYAQQSGFWIFYASPS